MGLALFASANIGTIFDVTKQMKPEDAILSFFCNYINI